MHLYRIYVWRDDPDDPHWELAGSAGTRRGATQIAEGWIDGNPSAVRIDRTILDWHRA